MPKPREEVIIEFVQQGQYMKVSAIDVRTGLEVSIVGDPKLSQQALEAAVMQRLQYVRRKRRLKREQQMGGKPKRTYRSTSGWDI